MSWADYGTALQRVADACVAEVDQSGLSMDPVTVDLDRCGPGEEIVRTDYVATVYVRLSAADAFLPPPDGATLIYGVCHEVAHIVIARVTGGHPLPPVVWDEALAHSIAIDWFLPGLADRIGTDVWPVPYPDFAAREAASACGNHEPGEWTSYSDLLQRQTDQIVPLARERGWPHILRCVASVAETSPRVEDWFWKFRGRATR